MGLIKAILEAIHGEDNKIAGRAITRLETALSSTEAVTMVVTSTIGFGAYFDGTLEARVMIDDEIIDAVSRTETTGNMTFTTLTRGVLGTKIQDHAVGAIVYDLSDNTSARGQVRRGFLLRFAQDEDLDVVGRNLGLHKCPGLDQETWRRIIQAVAFLPKNTVHAFEHTLEAYYDDTTSWEVYTLPQFPYRVFVLAMVPNPVADVRGRFYLNSTVVRLTTGLTQVTTPRAIRDVRGVYLDTPAARRGARFGLTNYFSGGGGFVLGTSTITLGSSPGAIGTSVLVDYAVYNGSVANQGYHYLAGSELILDDEDRYAYLTDATSTIRCLLDQVRPAGTRVYVSMRS